MPRPRRHELRLARRGRVRVDDRGTLAGRVLEPGPRRDEAEEVVGEGRVLREHRAVQVRADDVAHDDALLPGVAAVADAGAHAAERRALGADVVARVVLEADEAAEPRRRDDEIAGHAAARGHRPTRQDAETLDARRRRAARRPS